VIKHFERRYTQRTKRQKLSYDDVKVIPLNGERFLQFQIGNVKFIGSFQFFSASLDHLVSLLLKSGKENFHHTIKYMGNNDLVLAKGIYPYSYMNDRSKFGQTELPSKEDFHDALNDEPLSDENCQRARDI